MPASAKQERNRANTVAVASRCWITLLVTRIMHSNVIQVEGAMTMGIAQSVLGVLFMNPRCALFSMWIFLFFTLELPTII